MHMVAPVRAGSTDGVVKVWNFNLGGALHRLAHRQQSDVTGVCQLKNGTILATGWFKQLWGFRQKAGLFDTKPAQIHDIKQSHEDVQCLVCDQDSNLFLVGTLDGLVLLYSCETMQELHRFKFAGATALAQSY